MQGFAAMIVLGALLLMLPVSSRSGQFTPFVDALFTATSAVCVTGLVVLDTGTHWSPFGQGVILALFQIGGFGFMTSTTLLMMAIGRRIGLRERLLIGEAMGVSRPGGLVRIVRRIAIFTFLAEGIGVIVLFPRFLADSPPVTALWRAVFHSVSAFNNAGFDILGNFRSLQGYAGDNVLVGAVAILIILGGISYLVVDDMLVTRSLKRLSTDSKVVLVTTLSLLTLGTLAILLAEWSKPATIGGLSLPQRLLGAFFQSATSRSAGFSVVDVGKMAELSLFFTMFLMFVGGASGSTTGGIKVGTFAVLVITALSTLRGKEYTGAFGREFIDQNIHRALALVMFYLGLIGAAVLALSITEQFGLVNLLFEATSALGTVGLSTGITPELSAAGRLIITASMFVGRLGPLALVSALVQRQRPAEYRYPKAMVRIG